MNIAATAALLIALIPNEGMIFQEVAQEYSDTEECLDAQAELVEGIRDLQEPDVWVTEREYHTEIFNMDTLDEYRLICVDDTLVIEAS